MKYAMFIDDERFPPSDNRIWMIVRTWEEFLQCLNQSGIPSFISFDHDLGSTQPTGYDIAHYLISLDLDQPGILPSDFAFTVHSQNPVGAENIKRVLENYLEFRAKENQ